MTSITALPVNSVAPADWWRRVSTTVNTMLGLVADLYRRPIAAITADYSPASTDFLVTVDATAQPVTITLPVPTSGRQMILKRLDGSANAVTVAGQLDGSTSTPITGQWAVLRVIATDDQWLTA